MNAFKREILGVKIKLKIIFSGIVLAYIAESTKLIDVSKSPSSNKNVWL